MSSKKPRVHTDLSKVATRIITKVLNGEATTEMITHMLESLVTSRDRLIEYQSKKVRLYHASRIYEEKRVIGALRQTINVHGPITPEYVSSATKRIIGACSGLDSNVVSEREIS